MAKTRTVSKDVMRFFPAGEGGQEEAVEGEAAEVGDGQGEQAENNLSNCHLI